ncbi:unnamed protein product [Didymodactylos carnosus]|uniref:Uncharacterized protein n=1 Tax=Didymodactylos carnosus TaxID=1234261 RepID=A0A816B2B6_9BILA|nr:unnamed protein product [Didymodactylos carnosus]CAF4481595.1 unnamed protein product [Didymodactylos carnosus]
MSRHKLLKGSVSLTLTSGDDKIDRCAIVQAVSTILGSSDTIEFIGNLGSIREWFMGFGEPLSQQRLLQEGELKVEEHVLQSPPTVPHPSITQTEDGNESNIIMAGDVRQGFLNYDQEFTSLQRK